MKKALLTIAMMAMAGTAWADDLSIKSAEDWTTFCSSPETYADGSITLDAGISVDKAFPGTFTGTFNGQGHAITFDNLQVTGKFALFTATGEGASIRNLSVEGTVTSAQSFAAITLDANGNTSIENVDVKASITSSGYPLSGFVVNNKANLNFSNCMFSGHIKSTANASVDISGFISNMTGSSAFRFDRCAFTGGIEILSGWRAGAFVSSNTSTLVADCEFNYCMMSGSIAQGNQSERVGGFIGSPNSDKSSYIMNGCLMNGTCKRWNSNSDQTWITQENCIIMGCGTWKSYGKNTAAKNCYMTSTTEVTEKSMNDFLMVEDAAVASGALCYSLNGDQSSIGFYQTLGTDAAPVLDDTHARVYCSGRKHCDGTDYDGIIYNNESGSTTQDEHDYEDGVCNYCGALEEVDGYAHIKSQKAWDAFAEKLKSGVKNINVRLFCDVKQSTPLTEGYYGTLDGQGHSIDVTMGGETGRYSLFGNIGGATIRNLVLTGELTGESNTAALACTAAQPLLVENVISKVKVVQTTLNDGNCAGLVAMANNTVTFRNCISAATVAATKDAGGFVGWSAGKTIIMENCAMIGDVTVNTGNSAVFLRIRHSDCQVTMTDCYYAPCTPTILSGNGTNMAVKATEIDNKDITSGALCYKLNGDQSDITFYQNIGTDKMPSIDKIRGQVYANGHKHCDGTDYDDLVYSNEQGTTNQDEHDFDNGVCGYCGKLKMNENGVFEINDERTLAAFAKAVNGGENTISAIMTEDVTATMGTADAECQMIGIGMPYQGTFDGRGHTLTVNVDAAGTNGGVFQTLGSATIRNMVVEGTVRNGMQTGFIGDMQAGASTLENLIIRLDIEGKVNVGGVFGNCNNAANTVDMRNVMFAGKVKYVGNANQNGIGGFCGWAYDAKFTMKNCIMSGTIDLGTGTTPGQMLRARSTCSVKSEGCAYIPVEGVTYVNGNNAEMDASPVACDNATDGALCYAANGSSFQNPVWYQNIGHDDAPVLDSTHEVVYRSTEGYASKSKDDYQEIANDLASEAEAATEPSEHPAQKSLVAEYKAAVEGLAGAGSFEELTAAYYPTIADMRKAVESSMAAYASLTAKVVTTRAYIVDNANDFKGGPAYQKLESYVSDDMIDPDEEEFPNGSYAYIMDPDNLLLDEAGIATEIAFVDKMLEDALNEGLNPGADATSFIVNADFSDGFNGWEGTLMTSTDKGETNGMGVAESWSGKAFDMHQTITLPENGIYELTLGGAYRIEEQGGTYMHSAMVYMNGYKTFLQSAIEGMIPVDEAVDKENCWITGSTPDYAIRNSDNEITGYTAHGRQGAACAFGAGRYANRILVNVTDNTLTLGVRNSHAIYTGNEWVTIGNLKLTYHGTLEQADKALDATLADMCDRAGSIINSKANSENYLLYPNHDKNLTEELQGLVAKAGEAATAEEKYEIIGKMGETFEQLYECQKNYANLVNNTDAMIAACDMLQNAGAITKQESDDAYKNIFKTQAGYIEGTYSSEEAALGGDLRNISFLPTTNENGNMEICDAKSMNVFAAMVTTGMTELNAILTANITTNESFMMIGGDTSGKDYKYNGTFDGQGHTLTVNIEEPDKNTIGIFRHTGNAVIRNVKFTGSIIGQNNTGLVGQIDGNTRFENVESNINITGGNNVGGFAGAAYNGPQHFNNCLFSGKVTTTVNGGGGFYGWSATNRVYADNCLSIGEVVGEQCAYFFRVKCNGTVGTAGDAGCYVEGGNMYFLRTSDPTVLVSGTPLWWGEFLTDIILEVSEADLTSGKVCHTLNADNTEAPAWRQTLGTDATPLLNSDHLQVGYDEEKGYYNIKPDGISSVETETAKSGNACYDLTGRKVQRPTKGIYIIGGRKVLVK